jgi:hypothetical protein
VRCKPLTRQQGGGAHIVVVKHQERDAWNQPLTLAVSSLLSPSVAPYIHDKGETPLTYISLQQREGKEGKEGGGRGKGGGEEEELCPNNKHTYLEVTSLLCFGLLLSGLLGLCFLEDNIWKRTKTKHYGQRT